MRNEMLNALVKEINSIIEENERVEVKCIHKNNGVLLHGITIIPQKKDLVTPTFHFENYEQLLLDEGVASVAKRIVEAYREYHDKAPSIESLRFNPQNIIMRVVNYEKNKEQLKDAPYHRIFDLAIVYYVNVMEDGYVRLTNALLDRCNITKEKLFSVAKKNTMKIMPANGVNMLNLLMGSHSIDGMEPFHDKMYVVSNSKKIYGFAAILYDGVLQSLANEIEMDLILLPSSVHECIIMPYDDSIDVSYIKEMVKEVNSTEVLPEEVLSENVYVYRKDLDRIEILEKK